ncbi:unnamed protein product [Tilletia laevis]|uniref:C2H2-type domain-containing protein n=2 Tax=Tilletia TaxID=13289 RepID=A0A9N8LXV0_9BASI|nr:unnamed protein product [Tilletia laevis]
MMPATHHQHQQLPQSAAQALPPHGGYYYHHEDHNDVSAHGSLSSRSSISSINALSSATELSGDDGHESGPSSSWFSTSPPTMRGGRIAIPQTPNNSMRKMSMPMSMDTPGLSSSVSNTPVGGFEMPWTPVHPNYNRPMHGGLSGAHNFQQQDGKLQMFEGASPLAAPFGSNGINGNSQFGGSTGMSRIASAPLPFHPNMFEVPSAMPIELPGTSNPVMHTPEAYMWQSQDSYFSAPSASVMSRSMTEAQSGSSISPMVIMDRSLSSSSSMPSLNSSEADVLANTPSSAGKAPRKRNKRNRDPTKLLSPQHNPHECCVCNRRFIRLEHLKRHFKTHSQERPYPCPWPGCQKAFGRTDNRDQHIKTHAKGDPLKRSWAQLMALTKGEDGGRNDPHNAARSSAFAAIEANRHKRVSGLDGPIALTQPGLSPGSRRASQGENDENNMPNSMPTSPIKFIREHNSAPSSPPLQIRNQAELNSQSQASGPIIGNSTFADPFSPSYQHHFGENSMVSSMPSSSVSSMSAMPPHFMSQPLLYTITENELQFVATGAVAPFPLTPSMGTTTNNAGYEPPMLYSPSGLGLAQGVSATPASSAAHYTSISSSAPMSQQQQLRSSFDSPVQHPHSSQQLHSSSAFVSGSSTPFTA